MKALRYLLPAIAVCAGCQSYPFSFQTNQRVDARNYQVQVSTEGKTDILFVIDNSPSMIEEQANLKANMGRFISVLTRSVVDYQIGVITPDADRVPGANCEPCCDLDSDGNGLPDFSNCDAGRLVAANGLKRIFPRPTSEDPAELEEQTATLITEFNNVITSLGAEGSAFERSFENMRTALSDESDVAVRALNFGFLRPDADLAVIFMTDEDDCSHADATWFSEEGRDDSDCYRDPTVEAVNDFVDFLQELKGGDIRRVRGAAIVGATQSIAAPLGYAAAGCFTDTAADPANDASNACGCWSTRFVPDRTTSDPDDELFCNILSEAPYFQPNERTPALPNNQGGCSTLPGSRYVAFLEELDRRRAERGELSGVLIDSLCRSDYGQTLESIASNVVINNCFPLVEPPAVDFESVVLLRNGDALPKVELNSGDFGWSYNEALNAICLEGGLIKEVNDTYEFTVVSASKGFEDEDEAAQ